jgi:WD40 repeat protein
MFSAEHISLAMTDAPQVPSSPVEPTPGDRLDSWKEIAVYLRRDVKTVQRWEKREGMPVHRHLHDKLGSVYAFRTELDGWSQNRRLTTTLNEGPPGPELLQGASQPADDDSTREAHPVSGTRWPKWMWALAAIGAVAGFAVAASLLLPGREASNPLANARFLHLTDFSGIEQAAAISRDGKLVAFLSDRDGQMDAWVTQVGSGEFYNLTRGSAGELDSGWIATGLPRRRRRICLV